MPPQVHHHIFDLCAVEVSRQKMVLTELASASLCVAYLSSYQYWRVPPCFASVPCPQPSCRSRIATHRTTICTPQLSAMVKHAGTENSRRPAAGAAVRPPKHSSLLFTIHTPTALNCTLQTCIWASVLGFCCLLLQTQQLHHHASNPHAVCATREPRGLSMHTHKLDPASPGFGDFLQSHTLGYTYGLLSCSRCIQHPEGPPPHLSHLFTSCTLSRPPAAGKTAISTLPLRTIAAVPTQQRLPPAYARHQQPPHCK